MTKKYLTIILICALGFIAGYITSLFGNSDREIVEIREKIAEGNAYKKRALAQLSLDVTPLLHDLEQIDSIEIKLDSMRALLLRSRKTLQKVERAVYEFDEMRKFDSTLVMVGKR